MWLKPERRRGRSTAIMPRTSFLLCYREAAKYDDELEVRTTGGMVSPVRMKFDYEVVRTADHGVLAVGSTVHATLDRAGKPCRLPERVRALFS